MFKELTKKYLLFYEKQTLIFYHIFNLLNMSNCMHREILEKKI